MILSVSRRTDIPAFFSEWFYNRIKQGIVFVRNPMNIHQVSSIKITPEIIDCIVFWTKDPKYFILNLHLIKQYNFYFQYTITGYGKKMEPNVPSIEESINTFIKLSSMIGPQKVIWRYDPIIFTEEYNFQYHVNRFNLIADKLSGYTNKCVISFVDFYKKNIKNLSSIQYSITPNSTLFDLSERFNIICRKNKITLTSCAEEIDLSKLGISHGKCIDDKLIEEILGVKLNLQKDKNQRKECGCVASIDIGAYNTCPNGCLYCYANYSMEKVRNNYSQHNQFSELLFGEITPEDIITKRKVSSCKLIQKSFFD